MGVDGGVVDDDCLSGGYFKRRWQVRSITKRNKTKQNKTKTRGIDHDDDDPIASHVQTLTNRKTHPNQPKVLDLPIDTNDVR